MDTKETKKSFKETLNLPKTEFSIRAHAKTKEPELLNRWQEGVLYDKAIAKNKGKKTFTLHDGPPFANGHMHMGHALNRALKDFVCKAKRMSGYHVISAPGWDCHGLPIELKVMKEQGAAQGDRIAFKKKCRAYAQEWIDIQKEEILRLGVVTDWEHPYITMSTEYEAAILKAFAVFVENGYIERKGKTVPWCASCQTVLATAEIEHEDKKDPSCYILFPFDKEVSQKLFSELADTELNILVWTTTPWTIPLNRAVVLHPKAPYVVLQGKEGQAFIVGAELADTVCKEIGIEKKVLVEFKPSKLEGLNVNHPYIQGLQVPVILDDMVLLDDGTACVHSAPGCGPEDYFLGVKNGLEIFSPLSADGKYVEGIQPAELEGMPVLGDKGSGQIWSIKKLHEVGRLLHKTSLKHSYPHCWRCHNPLIFRATDQWFCDLKKEGLIDRAIEVANGLTFVPDWGKTRLTSSMASRTEWCLSRQRQWGVPIIALLCNECDHAYLNVDFIKRVAAYVAKEGIEFWDRISIQELIDEKVLPEDFSCEKCKSKDFRKEMDILDVWFESGVSHTAVQDCYPALKIPADLYLEGSDQHRGWFQSSLLSSMIMYGKTCTNSFVTHAYVLDAQAKKMSKSKGNVISPQDIINEYSADILRLWIAGCDFESDILVSDKQLKNVAQVYSKIRNTCRFMIANLYDFSVEKDVIPLGALSLIDQYALAELQNVITTIPKAYEAYDFTGVFRTLNEYCTNRLSAFYLDIIKDRLYAEKKSGLLRRSSQTTMYHILDALTRLMAPILSFLAEEISDYYQSNKAESIHLQDFPKAFNVWGSIKENEVADYVKTAQYGVEPNTAISLSFASMMTGFWNVLEQIRPELLKAIETQREKGVVKHSLEAKVTVFIDETKERAKTLKEFIEQLQGLNDFSFVRRFFSDFIIVSQFEFAKSSEGLEQSEIPWLYIKAEHADGIKCPRCWKWDVVEHEDSLCHRCQEVIEETTV